MVSWDKVFLRLGDGEVVLIEYAIVSGILFGIFYAFFAVGLNLVFGVQRIVNLAHGDVVMLGAFGTWELYHTLHWNPLFAVIFTVPPAIVAGFILYYGLAGRLAKSFDPEMVSLILFFGISQVIEAVTTLVASNNQRSLPDTTIASHPVRFLSHSYPVSLWAVAAISAPALLLLVAYLYRTRLGRATRAIMADPAEAASVGINVKKVSSISFGVGIALAAASGSLSIFMFGGVNPNEGVAITVTAFAIIVIGSLGNPVGTIVGGLIYGVIFEITQVYATSWANLVPYVLLLLVMLIKPSGILGKGTRYA